MVFQYITNCRDLIKDLYSKHQYLGYFTTDPYAVNGNMTYVDKLFFKIPLNFPKTIIIIPSADDLADIRSGRRYDQLNWYIKMTKIAKKYDANLIDLAMTDGYDNDVFLACDGHWSKKGNQKALEEFIARK